MKIYEKRVRVVSELVAVYVLTALICEREQMFQQQQMFGTNFQWQLELQGKPKDPTHGLASYVIWAYLVLFFMKVLTAINKLL